MTKGDNKRAILDFGDGFEVTNAGPIDTAAVKEATRAAGFRETPKSMDPRPAHPAAPRRRARRKTGRTEQFATRLRADTLDAIYSYADEHDITLAETIERAIAALRATE